MSMFLSVCLLVRLSVALFGVAVALLQQPPRVSHIFPPCEAPHEIYGCSEGSLMASVSTPHLFWFTNSFYSLFCRVLI